MHKTAKSHRYFELVLGPGYEFSEVSQKIISLRSDYMETLGWLGREDRTILLSFGSSKRVVRSL